LSISTFKCHIYILSFNRGPYLKICVDSVCRHIPDAPITVIDDGSTDTATVEILNQLPVEIHRPSKDKNGRHGGLYDNMNWAIENCSEPYLLFLQDDMQVVRDMYTEDWEELDTYFNADSRHAFAHVCFAMGIAKLKSRSDYKPWLPFRGYENDNGKVDQSQKSRRWVYDTSLAHVGRLREAKFQFGPTERDNAARAAGLFQPMFHFAEPFACQLPQVGVYRFGRRTLGERLSEKLSGNTPKRYHSLSDEEVAMLKSRPVEKILMADDILRPVDENVKRPFVHKGVNARWYTRAINKIELLLLR